MGNSSVGSHTEPLPSTNRSTVTVRDSGSLVVNNGAVNVRSELPARPHLPPGPPSTRLQESTPLPAPRTVAPVPPPTVAPTKLRLIELSCEAFFQAWQTQMKEHFHDEPEPGGDSTVEFVVADQRLQYLELLKLDGSVEIEFVTMGDDDTFLGVPCGVHSELSWKVSPGGWIGVPREMDPGAHRVLLSNRWWVGLKQSLNPSLRGLFRYDLFETRFLRLFITPVPGEDCVRAIVTTNMAVVVEDLVKTDFECPGSALLAECIVVKSPGEFPPTTDDLFGGSQLERRAEASQDAELLRIVSSSGPGDPPVVSGGPSDSFMIPGDLPVGSGNPSGRSVDPDRNPAGGPGDKSGGSCDNPSLVHSSPQETMTPGACVVPAATKGEAKDNAPADVFSVPTDVSVTTMKPPKNRAATANPLLVTKSPLLHLDQGPARPLPMLVRQTSAGVDVHASHLFPHQQRTVSWMLEVESGNCDPLLVPQSVLFGTSLAYHRGIWHCVKQGFSPSMLSKSVECLSAPSLALGGLVAHPVGSGKTVIAAELVRRTLHLGTTAVYVPPHIARQWRSELVRFVPGVQAVIVDDTGRSPPVSADVLIIPHNLAWEHTGIDQSPYYRIIVDEPQEVLKTPRIFNALVRNSSTRRWLLTATPGPLSPMMQLALGVDTSAARSLPYDSMLFWFSRNRCRRDPPFLCLPVPPLHIHMHPVTLRWQEMSVLHSFVIKDDLQSAIRLASFFHLVPHHSTVRTGRGLRGAKTFASMDDWVHQHRTALVEDLTTAKTELRQLERQVDAERGMYVKERRGGVAVGVDRGAVEDMQIADMLETEDEGVSPVLLQQRNGMINEISTLERRLAFLKTVTNSLTPEAECMICTNTLSDRVVSIMPCLHLVCEECALMLFREDVRASCPLCRMSTARKDVCRFVCSIRACVSDDVQQVHGSKIACVTQQLLLVLKTYPEDKVLVFGQWQDLLRQMCLALPSSLQYCFLDGPLGQRCDIIEEFRTNPKKRVMVLSSESQSSGANLEVANHVMIIHPYCPPGLSSVSVVPLAQAQAFEQQAIGRVLRFPQSKPVHVYRFYSVGTPEEELYTHWGWVGH